MEDAGGEHRVGARLDGRREVGELAGPAGGDDRYGDGLADGPDHLQVVAVLGAVRVHRVEQDLAGAQLGGAARPFDGVEAGALASAVRGDLVPRGGLRPRGAAPGVDGEHQHLAPEPLGDLADQFRPGDGGGVDAHLVGAGPQQLVDVLDGADAAADGERDEDLFGGAADHVVGGLAVAGGGGDVEEGELVGAFGVVELGHFDRVAGVAQVLEVDALDHPTGVDVQAGDDTYCKGHGCLPSGASRVFASPER